MTLTLDPVLENALNRYAQRQGISPETLAMNVLREKFAAIDTPIEPQDAWERLLLGTGKDCGVSLSDEALSSEGIYE
jgi:hypothetical protein